MTRWQNSPRLAWPRYPKSVRNRRRRAAEGGVSMPPARETVPLGEELGALFQAHPHLEVPTNGRPTAVREGTYVAYENGEVKVMVAGATTRGPGPDVPARLRHSKYHTSPRADAGSPPAGAVMG